MEGRGGEERGGEGRGEISLNARTAVALSLAESQRSSKVVLTHSVHVGRWFEGHRFFTNYQLYYALASFQGSTHTGSCTCRQGRDIMVNHHPIF